jgi:hypothetical protein
MKNRKILGNYKLSVTPYKYIKIYKKYIKIPTPMANFHFNFCYDPVRSFCSDGNGSPAEILCFFFGTGESGNVSLNSFWQDKYEQGARLCSTMNIRCTCEKDILALRLLKDN